MVNPETVAKLPFALRPVSDEQGANAAVALLLKPNHGDFEVLLVKRAVHPADVWSGQMALPGGKREPQDSDLKAVVARETIEETGINLSIGRFLGVLTAVQSVPRRDLRILPFVVQLEKKPEIALNSELEWYTWVPYEQIAQSEGKSMQQGFEVSAFLLPNAVVWGITYKILSDFIKTVEAAKTQ
ncbi:MAG: CoA pyrophosphatase [Chloroflexi bacterium]|nr:CoA pyrophosphatase [Chloroflexota bacterium]